MKCGCLFILLQAGGMLCGVGGHLHHDQLQPDILPVIETDRISDMKRGWGGEEETTAGMMPAVGRECWITSGR